VYSLKQLERKLPKAKGIVSQSVKDVLQSLVDEEKVDFDKIGSGNFFWSFPSKASQKRKNLISSLESEIGKKKRKLDQLQQDKQKASMGRDDTDSRRKKLQKYKDLQDMIAKVDVELSKFAASDPKTIEKKQKAIKCCWTNANRWIDNVFQILTFAKKKRPDLKDKDILKYMQLPEELDYLPDPKHGI